MTDYQWTENTKPDRPGIWMHRAYNGGFKMPVLCEYQSSCDGCAVGTWAFICDLPTIVDPPRYRPVTAADVGREIEVSTDGGIHYCNRRLIGFDGSQPVYHHSGDHYLCAKHARILDSGDDGQAKRAREWWVNGIYAYEDRRNAGTRGIHVREVID